MNEKKVILVTAGMAGGGTERVIAVLANYLIEKKHAVTILMTSREDVAYELHEDVRVVAIGKSTGGSPVKRMKRILDLHQYFRQDKSQAIVSFGTETNLFSLLAHVGVKNKLIVSERNDPNQCGYPHLRNLVYRMADRLVFQTEEARLCFPKKIADRGVVIPNPLAKNMVSVFTGERSHDIVAVGRLEPQKNHKMLLRAFALFDRKYPDYRLVLYGEGFLLEELKALAEELHIADKVVFAGFTQEVEKRIQGSAMYVLSSDYEGISNSLMEAMALGLPVVSTDCPIGGSAMLIQDKESGMLTPVGDAKAFADAMCYMAEDKARAAVMGKRAEYVKQAYSVENICRKWMQEIDGGTVC